MKRVLFLFVTMPVGGAEMLCFELLKGLDPDRYRTLVCCIGEEGELGREIERSGFEVLALGRMQSRRFEAGTVRALADLLRSRKIDILHANMYHANLYGRLAALTLGRRRPRLITAVHSLYSRRKFHRLLISRFLNRHTDRILAVSQAVKDDVVRYEKVSPDKVTVLPLGADFDRLDLPMTQAEAKERLGFSPGDCVLGTVGRLVEEKGHGTMLEALAILRDRGYDFKLLLVGGGRLEGSLRQRAGALEVQDRVHFAGHRRDIPELYRAMDLYLMASTSEAASIALLEAMGAGLPCVVTSVGGMMDLVDGGRCARVVPPGSPTALVEGILDVHGSEALRIRLARAGRERARSRYGKEAMVQRLESIYEGLF